MTTLGPKLVTQKWMIPVRFGAALVAPVNDAVADGFFERMFYNPLGTDPEAWRRLMVYGTADVAGGTALQLISLMESGASCRATGQSTCAPTWRRSPPR